MYTVFKRAFDVIGAALLLLAVGLPMAIVALTVKMTSKGPVLFKQKRIGKNKKEFSIYKFRTMSIDAPRDCPTHMLGRAVSYITPVGAFLRRTSIDELPQLFNILKGDMSFVGPRPALWNQFDLIALRDRYGANDIVPGLTGWAQVNGRDEIGIEEKARLDGYYTQHRSFAFDVRCLFRTVVTVAKEDGVKEGGTGTSSNDKERLG